MVCHLFLKENPLAVGDWPGQVRNHSAPIGFARCDYFISAGMRFARGAQILCVQRLVNDNRIVPITPRAHHGRRDISRTRPHGDAEGLSHSQKFWRQWRVD